MVCNLSVCVAEKTNALKASHGMTPTILNSCRRILDVDYWASQKIYYSIIVNDIVL